MGSEAILRVDMGFYIGAIYDGLCCSPCIGCMSFGRTSTVEGGSHEPRWLWFVSVIVMSSWGDRSADMVVAIRHKPWFISAVTLPQSGLPCLIWETVLAALTCTLKVCKTMTFWATLRGVGLLF